MLDMILEVLSSGTSSLLIFRRSPPPAPPISQRNAPLAKSLLDIIVVGKHKVTVFIAEGIKHKLVLLE